MVSASPRDVSSEQLYASRLRSEFAGFCVSKGDGIMIGSFEFDAAIFIPGAGSRAGDATEGSPGWLTFSLEFAPVSQTDDGGHTGTDGLAPRREPWLNCSVPLPNLWAK
jgi:hypothetical protein